MRRFRVTVSVDLEGDVRGRRGFNLERGTVEVVVFAEEVIGGLAKVLCTHIHAYIASAGGKKKFTPDAAKKVETNLPGWGNGLRQRHYVVMNELNERGVYALAEAEKKCTNASAFWPSAVGKLESDVRSNSPIIRPGELARSHMSVRYISRDVCQTVFYVILHIRTEFPFCRIFPRSSKATNVPAKTISS